MQDPLWPSTKQYQESYSLVLFAELDQGFLKGGSKCINLTCAAKVLDFVSGLGHFVV